MQSNQHEILQDMISKLFFSRTQESYFKMYGTDTQYLVPLENLINKVDKKKLQKIVEEVKSSNHGFAKYLEKNRIVRLNFQHVLTFQNGFLSNNKKNASSLSHKTEGSFKQLSTDIIRIGFLMILERLEREQMTTFRNQARYLEQAIERQKQNLKRLGYQYIGFQQKRSTVQLIGQLQRQEKQNGIFVSITQKAKQEYQIVQQVEDLAFLK